MKKIVFFCSTSEMTENAKNIIAEIGREDIDVLKITTENCAEMAMEAVKNGAEIIIARGTQAAAIKHSTSIPVVEVVLTAQEIGLVIMRAKRDIGKDVPTIGIVGYSNMFCDMRHFDELFNIRLKLYYVKGTDELRQGVEQASQDHVDVIIGGEIVCAYAQELGLSCRMQPSGEDSIRQAFRTASSVAYAAEQEKKTASELNTLLDFSFNGILKIDKNGMIQALNHQIESLFGLPSSELIGSHTDRLFPSFFKERLQPDVLLGGKEIFSVVRVNGLVLAVSADPIRIDGKVEGAIVSCHEVRRLSEIEAETRREMQQNDETIYPFQSFFTDDLIFMRNAEHYAQFDEPILIASKPGMPREAPARIVHRESPRSAGPFVFFSCSAWPWEQHMEMLFGIGSDSPDSMIAQANDGTLYLDDIEQLSRQSQYQLYKLITDNFTRAADGKHWSIRIIAGTEKNLWKQVEEGRFRKDLYYVLTTLMLQLPELDAERWASIFIQQYCASYFRFLNLRKAAKCAIAEHPWEGGLIELSSFCKRLVITAPQRIVDDTLVNRILKQGQQLRENPERVTRDPEANRLAELLEQFGGNRAQVAEVLGISKTTLWRKMKKLGLYDRI